MLFRTKSFLSCLLFALAANAVPVPTKADAFQEPEAIHRQLLEPERGASPDNDDARFVAGGPNPTAAILPLIPLEPESSDRIEKRGKDKPPGPSSSSPSVEKPLSPPSHTTVQWLPRTHWKINRKERERLGQALADAGDRNVFIDKPVHTFFASRKVETPTQLGGGRRPRGDSQHDGSSSQVGKTWHAENRYIPVWIRTVDGKYVDSSAKPPRTAPLDQLNGTSAVAVQFTRTAGGGLAASRSPLQGQSPGSQVTRNGVGETVREEMKAYEEAIEADRAAVQAGQRPTKVELLQKVWQTHGHASTHTFERKLGGQQDQPPLAKKARLEEAPLAAGSPLQHSPSSIATPTEQQRRSGSPDSLMFDPKRRSGGASHINTGVNLDLNRPPSGI